MKPDYTREEFAEILEKVHKMSGDIDGGVYKLLEIDKGVLEIDLNYLVLFLWSGLDDPDGYAFQFTADSYRAIERKLTCFYEMLEID